MQMELVPSVCPIQFTVNPVNSKAFGYIYSFLNNFFAIWAIQISSFYPLQGSVGKVNLWRNNRWGMISSQSTFCFIFLVSYFLFWKNFFILEVPWTAYSQKAAWVTCDPWSNKGHISFSQDDFYRLLVLSCKSWLPYIQSLKYPIVLLQRAATSHEEPLRKQKQEQPKEECYQFTAHSFEKGGQRRE